MGKQKIHFAEQKQIVRESQKEGAQSCTTGVDAYKWVGIFGQSWFVQRVTVDNKPAYNIGTYSLMGPEGMRNRAPDIIVGALRREANPVKTQQKTVKYDGSYPQASNNTIVSFTEDNTLLAHFRQSNRSIDDQKLQMIAAMFESLEAEVNKNEKHLNPDHVRKFREYNTSVKLKLSNGMANIGKNLKSSIYSDETAWSTDYGGAFKQVGIFEDGTLFMTGPNGKTDLMTIPNTPDAQEWVKWVRDLLALAQKNNVESLFGYHVDTTKSVKGCAGSDLALSFYDQSMEFRIESNAERTRIIELQSNTLLFQDQQQSQQVQNSNQTISIQIQAQSSSNNYVCPGCGSTVHAGHVCVGKR